MAQQLQKVLDKQEGDEGPMISNIWSQREEPGERQFQEDPAVLEEETLLEQLGEADTLEDIPLLQALLEELEQKLRAVAELLQPERDTLVELVERALQHKLVIQLELVVQMVHLDIMLGAVLLVKTLQVEELEAEEIVLIMLQHRHFQVLQEKANQEQAEAVKETS